jgi:uncharacterized membrane protein YeaQ/YmgE (transglycosylase-associated protein family)
MSGLASLLEFVPFGLLIGALGRALGRGRGRLGWVLSMVLACGGALVGGELGRLVVPVRGEAPLGFAASLLGAFFIVTLHHTFFEPRLDAARPVRR